jgi:hypothetical protein
MTTMTVVRSAEAIACSALDTLTVLSKHQRGCQQCHFDDLFCETAQSYQKAFLDEWRRYVRARPR